MLSVVIPTLNAAGTLPRCLEALVPAALDGLIRDVLVADAGSTDATLAIAEAAGCTILPDQAANRGAQLKAGAASARGPWLLFLHADTVLQDGWAADVAAFIHEAAPGRVAAFTFALDEQTVAASIVATGVALRSRLLGLPYGDQGLLISKQHYDALGGHPPYRLMEDVALIGIIPRRQRHILAARAVTSATRYRRDGYPRRILRNWLCLGLYAVGVSPERIVRIYQRPPKAT